jgi:hypothetical protein
VHGAPHRLHRKLHLPLRREPQGSGDEIIDLHFGRKIVCKMIIVLETYVDNNILTEKPKTEKLYVKIIDTLL